MAIKPLIIQFTRYDFIYAGVFQLIDGSIGLSPFYPVLTIDLLVRLDQVQFTIFRVTSSTLLSKKIDEEKPQDQGVETAPLF